MNSFFARFLVNVTVFSLSVVAFASAVKANSHEVSVDEFGVSHVNLVDLGGVGQLIQTSFNPLSGELRGYVNGELILHREHQTQFDFENLIIANREAISTFQAFDAERQLRGDELVVIGQGSATLLNQETGELIEIENGTTRSRFLGDKELEEMVRQIPQDNPMSRNWDAVVHLILPTVHDPRLGTHARPLSTVSPRRNIGLEVRNLPVGMNDVDIRFSNRAGDNTLTLFHVRQGFDVWMNPRFPNEQYETRVSQFRTAVRQHATFRTYTFN